MLLLRHDTLFLGVLIIWYYVMLVQLWSCHTLSVSYCTTCLRNVLESSMKHKYSVLVVFNSVESVVRAMSDKNFNSSQRAETNTQSRTCASSAIKQQY